MIDNLSSIENLKEIEKKMMMDKIETNLIVNEKDGIEKEENKKEIEEEDTIKKKDLSLRTNISSISNIPKKNDDVECFSFLDESKKGHDCVVTMKFLNSHDVPEHTDVHCFWCRHPFFYRPVGCPIKYVSNRIKKIYKSEITKQMNSLYENMSGKQIENLEKFVIPHPQEHNDEMFFFYKKDYYLVDGLFCSFNCCLAFILENNNNPLYYESENFLKKIYFDVYGESASVLIPAASWRLLKDYGGHMPIEEFRKNFFKIEYLDIKNVIYPVPDFKLIGFLFEKQVKI